MYRLIRSDPIRSDPIQTTTTTTSTLETNVTAATATLSTCSRIPLSKSSNPTRNLRRKTARHWLRLRYGKATVVSYRLPLVPRRQHERCRNRRTGQVGRRVHQNCHVPYGAEANPTHRHGTGPGQVTHHAGNVYQNHEQKKTDGASDEKEEEGEVKEKSRKRMCTTRSSWPPWTIRNADSNCRRYS